MQVLDCLMHLKLLYAVEAALVDYGDPFYEYVDTSLLRMLKIRIYV